MMQQSQQGAREDTTASRKVYTKDERTKHIRALAGRNGYLTLCPISLLAGLHDWVTRGDTLGIWVTVSLIAISLLFLVLMNARVLTVKTFDERANQLILRNFLWAFYLMLAGGICYSIYVAIVGHFVAGPGNLRTWGAQFQVMLLVVIATYVIKELEDNGQWSAVYWILCAGNAFIASVYVLDDLIEVVTAGSLYSLIALMLNPYSASLLIVLFTSLRVIRFYNTQEAQSNE